MDNFGPYGEIPKISQVIVNDEDQRGLKASEYKIYSLYNISAIVSIIKGITFDFSEQISHICIQIDDEKQAVISEYFDKTFDFIETNLKCKNVLVHCAVGQSRSATIVIAYLIRKFNWDYFQAYDYLKSKRQCIQPNTGFADQLEKYSTKYLIVNKNEESHFL